MTTLVDVSISTHDCSSSSFPISRRYPALVKLPDFPDNFENGKFMMPLGTLVEEPWEVRRFHLWYMHAVKLGMKQFVMSVPKEYFHLEDDAYLSVVFHDMHRLLRRKNLDVAQVTLFTM